MPRLPAEGGKLPRNLMIGEHTDGFLKSLLGMLFDVSSQVLMRSTTAPISSI